MTAHGEATLMDQQAGIGIDDMPAIYREGYLHAIESARDEHDPATEWDRFREYLWHALVGVFGLDVTQPWPAEGTSEQQE